jgi:hypothetical protein
MEKIDTRKRADTDYGKSDRNAQDTKDAFSNPEVMRTMKTVVRNVPNKNKVSNDYKPKDDKSAELAKDVTSLANGKVGDAENIQKKIDQYKLGDQEVPKDPSLKDFMNESGKTTWNDLKKNAENIGWKKLDDMISASAHGDHSKDEELMKNFVTGSGSQRNTGNIDIRDVAGDRLTKTKEFLDTNKFGRNTSVANAIINAGKTWDNDPKNAKDLMKDFEFVANGKSDGAATLADAINSGKAGVKSTDKIDPSLIKPGGAADKLLGDKTDITYGQLIDRVHNEGTTAQSDLKDKLTRDVAALNAAIDPMFIPGSPGNDFTTIQQNLEKMMKDLDPNDPKSKFSEINALYGKVFDDINQLAEMGIKSPSNDKFMKDLTDDIVGIQDKTAKFFDRAAEYFDKVSENVAGIKDKAQKEQLYNTLFLVFGSVASLGSIGFASSNGVATGRQFKAGGKEGGPGKFVNALKGNAPALFGSGTLFANNANLVGISADRIASIKNMLKNVPGVPPNIGEQLQNTSANITGAVDKMVNRMQKTDYELYNKDRWQAYTQWALKNRDKSSLFNDKANDSAYDKPMPYVFWKPGQGDDKGFLKYFPKQETRNGPVVVPDNLPKPPFM